MNHFLPWRRETIFKHSPTLQKLLEFSFQPGSPETALDCPILTNTHNSLLESSPCKICQLIFSLVKRNSIDIKFYEDYACLCFFALYAPKSWTSTFMVAADLLELLWQYFPEFMQQNDIYQPGKILGIDIQLHFFIQRCFKTISTDNILDISNLHFLKNEFIKGALTGSVSNMFCFKTIWHSLQANIAGDQTNNVCCNTTQQQIIKNKSKTDQLSLISPSLQHVFFLHSSQETKSELLSVFLDIWKPSDLLNIQHQQLLEGYGEFNFLYPENGDLCQGPCLLSQSLQLKKQNKTSSICILCECLAAHPEAHHALNLLKDDILKCIENNVKLTDRISFLIEDLTSFYYISDPLLKDTIRGCSPQEIHKHLFCDPLCAINSVTTCPDILFKVPNFENFQRLKSSLAVGLNLTHNSILDCDTLNTLVIIFKTIQVCKVGKTTFLEVIKELNSLLKKHSLFTLHTFHTAKIYC